MNLYQLQVFRSAALNSSFTKASTELHISQSTESLHIKHLEEELGCPLFIRVGRRAVLSPAGELLVMHVEKIFRDVKNAEMDVRETNALQRGIIRLGTVPSIFEYRLPRILSIFSHRFPQPPAIWQSRTGFGRPQFGVVTNRVNSPLLIHGALKLIC